MFSRSLEIVAKCCFLCNFYSHWNHKKTCGFLMISGEWKSIWLICLILKSKFGGDCLISLVVNVLYLGFYQELQNLFKGNRENSRTVCRIFLKLTMRTPKCCQFPSYRNSQVIFSANQLTGSYIIGTELVMATFLLIFNKVNRLNYWLWTCFICLAVAMSFNSM